MNTETVVGRLAKCLLILLVAAGVPFFCTFPAAAQVPEGFGSATTGGAGYPIVLVTTLEDYDPALSPVIVGSLRWALSGENRQIQFAVGGNIDLKVKLGIRGKANVTVDGSTAPFPGITLRYDQLEIRDGASNIIVRHIRLRDGADRGSNIPGISIYKRADRIWIDHCTVTRASDESIGVYGGAIGEGRPTNVTLSWNLIADATTPGFVNSGKAILVGGPGSGGPGTPVTGEMADRVTIHHNAMFHNDQRNPQVSGNTNSGVQEPLVDVRDNIIDQWTNYGSRFRWAATGNIVKNIFMSSQKGFDALILELPGAVYTSGNVAPPQGAGGVDINTMGTIATPIAAPAITEDTPSDLPTLLLGDGVTSGVGALPRDAYDTGVITRLAADLTGWLRTCSQQGGSGCQSGETCSGGSFGPSSDFGSLCCVGGTCSGSTPVADTDGDGVPDATDNCPAVANPTQSDADGDGIGDACDNCPAAQNPTQSDTDSDGIGDLCDNCPATRNPTQSDADGDGVGDACDPCPAGADSDGDGVCDTTDNCVSVYNPAQTDTDHDGIGDACDTCGLEASDGDADGICDSQDNCRLVYNPGQADLDGDGIGDACDPCPLSADSDGDGICDTSDNCVSVYNPAQTDTDHDGIGDACDTCRWEDADGDGICDAPDNCPTTANPGQADLDGDGIGDVCDNCPAAQNPTQSDADGDGIGDACDPCPTGADSDGDGECDTTDNCVSVYNPAQTDTDGDGIGDACDTCTLEDGDVDGDGICDIQDNCPLDYNPGQADLDGDGIGDACDLTVTFPLSGEITCADPPPTITWTPGGYNRFKVMVGADPAFSVRIFNGQGQLHTTSWTVPLKKWTAICESADPNLYIRVMGKIAGTNEFEISDTDVVTVK